MKKVFKTKLIFIIFLLLIIFIVSIFTLKSVNNNESKFKIEYESLNNNQNYRKVNINNDNPFIYSTPEEILEKINNGDTFYIYFGSKLCPWCRSVIEKAIEISNKNNIDEIYYVDIWDSEGNEIMRDKYVVENNSLEKIIDGTKVYFQLLDKLSNVLDDYILYDDNNEFNTNEKRIYAPTFIYIENGNALRETTGISTKQTNSKMELTEEILEDEEKQFSEFFIEQKNVCEEETKC